MEKKRSGKMPEIGLMCYYMTLDELFEQLHEYIKDNIQSDNDYKKMAEYLWSLGDGGGLELEIAYFKLVAKKIKHDFPNSYKKLMDFINEFETEDCSIN